jgi:hypothetical protein
MSTVPIYDKATPDVARGLTGALWQQSLQKYVSADPRWGVRVQDDFVVPPRGVTGDTSATADGNWSAIESATTGGTYTLSQAAGPDGIGRLNSTGTSNHQGIEVQGPAVVTLPTHKTAATKRGEVVFECRFDKSDADTIFIGLSEAGAAFLSATSTLPEDSDYIGFYSTDNGASWSFVCANDNEGNTAVTDSFTIPSAAVQSSGFQKFGFRVNTDSSVEVVINGNWYGKQTNGIVSTALPIETLVPRLTATAGGGTTAPTLDIDCIDVFVAAA